MELPTRFVRDFMRAAAACGVDAAPVLAALPALRARVEAGGRVRWDDCAVLMDRVGALVGSMEAVETLGGATVEATAPWAFVHLVPHLVAPTRLLRIGVQFVGPSLFPHMRHDLETRADGTLRLSLSLPPPYAGCETFFRMCAGGLRKMPMLCGHSAALVVVESMGPRGAVFAITPPPSRTLVGRARRAVRALLGESALFEEMAHQHEAMQDVFGALLRTQSELREFMERIPDTLVVHREGVIVWANQALLTSLKCASLEELVGKRIIDFVHPPDRPSAIARMGASMGDTTSETYRVRATDGTLRTLDLSPPQSVTFEGAPARMSIARDVTERDALRDQLVLADRMSQLGFLAAGVAHEINNPLAYAMAAVERAQRDLAAVRLDSAAESLAIARDGAERVRAITSDLRMFSRGGERRVEPVDAAQVLRATVDLAAVNIRTRGRLVTELGPLPRVLGDEGRLGQVFMNLLVNALDAVADRDPAASRIDVRAFTDAEGRAVVEVEDNGSGIPRDVLPRIFDPFFTTKGPRSGSGLGLAICHRIVTDLGGTIVASSDADAGALFRVTFPPHAAPARAPEAPARRPRRLRVLVIDDEPALARALAMMLEDDHDVDVLTSGEEALQRLGEGAEYDAILCDLMMAGLGGMDVYERLEVRHPAMARRLVFMTGGAFTKRAQQFLGVVKNPCLDKPFTLEGVLGALEEVQGGP